MQWTTWFLIYIGLNIFLVEWCLSKLKRAQNVVEARDSGFPAFRRLDTKTWNRREVYNIAILTVPLRVCICMSLLASSAFVSWVLRFSHDESKPLTGCKFTIMKSYYWFVCSSIIFILPGGVVYEKDPLKTDQFDYSYYLGPDY